MKMPPARGDRVSDSLAADGTARTQGTKLGCVVLAHNDPRHLRRLIDALDPFPVYLHCDLRTPGDTFEQMTTGLPPRCVVLDRVATGWAQWGLVEAEIAGYRAALADPGVSHIAVLRTSRYEASGATLPSGPIACTEVRIITSGPRRQSRPMTMRPSPSNQQPAFT
jgi:hypothetical protein